MPDMAALWAMPEPMRPAPTTARLSGAAAFGSAVKAARRWRRPRTKSPMRLRATRPVASSPNASASASKPTSMPCARTSRDRVERLVWRRIVAMRLLRDRARARCAARTARAARSTSWRAPPGVLPPSRPRLRPARARSMAARSSDDGCTTSSTSPARSARRADSRRALRMRSSARGRPTRRGKHCVPPPAGSRPSCTSGSPMRTLGESAAMRQSHASASSKPPPSALPLIAATVVNGSAPIAPNDGVHRAARDADLRGGEPLREHPEVRARDELARLRADDDESGRPRVARRIHGLGQSGEERRIDGVRAVVRPVDDDAPDAVRAWLESRARRGDGARLDDAHRSSSSTIAAPLPPAAHTDARPNCASRRRISFARVVRMRARRGAKGCRARSSRPSR